MPAGYYITNPAEAIEFPVTERYGSVPYDIEDSDIDLETDGGESYTYNEFSRRYLELLFIGTWAEMEFFRDFHILIGGKVMKFWFVPDMTNISVAYYVKKISPCKFNELKDPAAVDGSDVAIYEHKMILIGQPTPGEVLA